MTDTMTEKPVDELAEADAAFDAARKAKMKIVMEQLERKQTHYLAVTMGHSRGLAALKREIARADKAVGEPARVSSVEVYWFFETEEEVTKAAQALSNVGWGFIQHIATKTEPRKQKWFLHEPGTGKKGRWGDPF